MYIKNRLKIIYVLIRQKLSLCQLNQVLQAIKKIATVAKKMQKNCHYGKKLVIVLYNGDIMEIIKEYKILYQKGCDKNVKRFNKLF